MNERNLSRRLSSSVVDALKAHGHILVVKGGATALARELDELMAPEITTIEPRLRPYTPLVGEPTSTFGDETVDQAVEDMVQKLTHALMRSDHVEDVFAEDAVIRRDIFRVVRDGLREPVLEGGDDGDHASVTVKLDALGYVAATASRRTDPSTLRQALDRAASVAGARFSGFSAELREATFRLEGGSVDEGLEIEEAVADELTNLVEQGVVELPTIERRIDLGRPLAVGEQRSLRARIDAAAEATLLRSGCAASWELADARTIRVLFTPLSDQDARGVDPPTSAFAREVAALLAGRADPRSPATHAVPTPDGAGDPPRAAARMIEGPRSSRSPAKVVAKEEISKSSARAAAMDAPTPSSRAGDAPRPSEPAGAPRRKTKEAKAAPEPAPPSAPKAPAKRAAKTAKKSAAKTAAASRKSEASRPASRGSKATSAKASAKAAPKATRSPAKKR